MVGLFQLDEYYLYVKYSVCLLTARCVLSFCFAASLTGNYADDFDEDASDKSDNSDDDDDDDDDDDYEVEETVSTDDESDFSSAHSTDEDIPVSLSH